MKKGSIGLRVPIADRFWSKVDKRGPEAKRGRSTKGEKQGNSVLTEPTVLEIRKIYSNGNTSQADLGRQFGVTCSTIFKIVHRQTWSHI